MMRRRRRQPIHTPRASLFSLLFVWLLTCRGRSLCSPGPAMPTLLRTGALVHFFLPPFLPPSWLCPSTAPRARRFFFFLWLAPPVMAVPSAASAPPPPTPLPAHPTPYTPHPPLLF